MLRRLVHELRLAALALQFLTRLPVPRSVGFEPAWLNACTRHFPLVGGLVGAMGAVVLLAALQLWPPPVAALLAVAATVFLTGALHEDGLADTFDALGGAVSREAALAIMKDSRIGSFGALALLLVTVLRVAALAVLAQHDARAAACALVAAHVAARAVPVALMVALPYAGKLGQAKAGPLGVGLPRHALAGALAWVALMAGGLHVLGAGGSRLLLAGLAAGLVSLAMGWWLRRRLRGYTGDTLGATEQLAEAAVLLAWSAAW